MTAAQVDDLVELYATGLNAVQVAEAFSINRETVLLHLKRREVPSRAKVRKLDGSTVAAAVRRYVAGDAMAAMSADCGVNATTLRRELIKAGIPLRPRGRPPRRANSTTNAPDS